MKRVLDTELIQVISGFERLTRTKVKDCYPHQGKLMMIVNPGQAKKAVGPEGKTLKLAETKLGKTFKIVEYNPDLLVFVKNVLLPLKANKIELTAENEITVTGPDEKTRGLMIGAKAQNLRFTESIVQQYFPELKEIKIIG